MRSICVPLNTAKSQGFRFPIVFCPSILRFQIKTEIEDSQAGGRVDFWKVGKLNHNKAVEQSVDWPKFRDDATAADSYCVFDDRQVAVVGEEMVKYGMGRARCVA